MCIGGKPSAPVYKATEKPQAPAQESDPAVAASRDNARKRKQAAAASNNTLVSGGQGITSPAQTAAKTLYGQ